MTGRATHRRSTSRSGDLPLVPRAPLQEPGPRLWHSVLTASVRTNLRLRRTLAFPRTPTAAWSSSACGCLPAASATSSVACSSTCACFPDNRALVFQDPILLVSIMERTMVPKLEYLQTELAMSTDEAVAMALRCPTLFTFDVQRNFKPKLEYLMEEMAA